MSTSTTSPSALATPPSSPARPVKVRPKQAAKPSVPIAHDITSLLLSLQGISQRLDPYVSPPLQWVTFVFTWQNKYVSLLAMVIWVLTIAGGTEWGVHWPWWLAIVGLGWAYARRLGRGVPQRLGNPTPPSLPHMLHYLISLTSTMHSILDTMDSLASLVTFTRKSERASLGLFRAVLVSYVLYIAAVFCIGVKGVTMLGGIVVLGWGSDFGEVLRESVVKRLHGMIKNLGMEVEWIAEEEEDEEEESLLRKDSKSKALAVAVAEEADMLRRGSQVAARQLMGVSKPAAKAQPTGTTKKSTKPGTKPAAKSGAKAASKKPAAASATPATGITSTTGKLSPPVMKVARPETIVTSESAPHTTEETSPAKAKKPTPDPISTEPSPVLSPESTEQPLQEPTPEATPTRKFLSPSPQPTVADQSADRPRSTGSSTSSETGNNSPAADPRSSSSSTESDTLRVKSRLAEVVRSTASPKPTTPPEVAAPEKQDEESIAPNEQELDIPKRRSIDESNVTVDLHPDWSYPTDVEPDEFRKSLAGSLLRNRRPTPYTVSSVEDDITQDYFAIPPGEDVREDPVGKDHDFGEDDEEEDDHLPYLRRRRSCDSDVTIDALAHFSHPKRSSYQNTAILPLPPSRTSSRSASISTNSTVSLPSNEPERQYHPTLPRSRSYSQSNSQPRFPSPDLSQSPSPLERLPTTQTGQSSRSSIRGANRRPLNLVLSFETYENQRWWVGVGWVPHLLPTERGAWTDHTGTKTLPKSSFDIPDFQREQLDAMNLGDLAKEIDLEHSRYAWDWDGPWHIDMYGSSSGTTDDDGWEYGDNFWSGWKNRKTLKRVVRRRRWVRLARLYELGRKRSVTFGQSIVFEEPPQIMSEDWGDDRSFSDHGSFEDDDEGNDTVEEYDDYDEHDLDIPPRNVSFRTNQDRSSMWADIEQDMVEEGDVNQGLRQRSTSMPVPGSVVGGGVQRGRERRAGSS